MAHIQENEATPEELILLANCDIEEITEKLEIVPKINFYTEVSKIILDTLRQNSKLLHLYNDVASNLFKFCMKFECKKEYKKLADVLHMHFQKLVKEKKNPDIQNAKIPYPVKLDDPECQIKLWELRRTQMEYALKMEEWSDAFKASDIIFVLINKQDKKIVKGHLESFFTDLA